MNVGESFSRALKIAIVRPYFTTAKGGAERYAVETARGLAALGHSVHVFAYAWDAGAEDQFICHRVWMPRKPAWLRVAVFCRNVRRELASSDYDAVLGMAPFWPQSVCWLGDGLYAVWTRVSWPHAALRWLMCLKRAVMAVNLWIEKRALGGGAERFLAISQLIKRQAIQYYAVPPERIDVIYPGIDTARFNLEARTRWRSSIRSELALGDHEVVLLFAANNYRRKGLALLTRAFARARRAGAPLRLLVAGAGAARPYERLARRCGVAGQVTFVHFVDAVEKYYAAADLFVLPTRYDPFASVCLEAMACGLPVVTTDMAGAAELIDPGKTGEVIPSGDAERLLESILRDLRAVDPCAAMGRAAAERAKDFSQANQVRQIARVLEQVAARRRANRSLEIVSAGSDLAVNREYLGRLQGRGLDSVGAVMDFKASQERFYNRFKQIALFDLGDSAAEAVFVKRHRAKHRWSERIKFWRDPTTVPDGVAEWNNLLAFHRSGLPAATPVAAGERWSGGAKESFVMTLALRDGYLAADEYISERFSNSPADPHRQTEKRRLIRALARLAREMHWRGFHHRDFYLCHIFAKSSESGQFDLRLIDLQRAGHRRRLRRRWLIKDLAQLHYSSLGLHLSDFDRLRFYAWYWNRADSRKARHRGLKQILRKSRAIARHDAKLTASRLSTAEFV
jgi:UDP-glucose:(heptosyl)LPS alpha-1,3-glucosyltransferase